MGIFFARGSDGGQSSRVNILQQADAPRILFYEATIRLKAGSVLRT